MNQPVLIGKTSDFPAEQLKTISAGGISILIARVGDQFYAIANKCPHLGLSLAGGKLEGNVITCPWHNSRFDVCTGQNLDWVPGIVGVKMPGWVRSIVALGKQPQGVTTFHVTEKAGDLFLEL